MDTQIDPSKHGRKREDFEIERDRVTISELSLKGMSDIEIADYLNARPNVSYTLSRQMVGYDRRVMLSRLHEEQQANTKAWVTEEIMRLNMIEREAWTAWQRSIETIENKKIVESLMEIAKDGNGDPIMDMVVERVERAINQQVGDRGFLEIILKCINERARLRGLHKLQVKVEQETTYKMKMYQGWNPAQAWGASQIIDGEAEEARLLEDGN